MGNYWFLVTFLLFLMCVLCVFCGFVARLAGTRKKRPKKEIPMNFLAPVGLYFGASSGNFFFYLLTSAQIPGRRTVSRRRRSDRRGKLQPYAMAHVSRTPRQIVARNQRKRAILLHAMGFSRTDRSRKMTKPKKAKNSLKYEDHRWVAESAKRSLYRIKKQPFPKRYSLYISAQF